LPAAGSAVERAAVDMSGAAVHDDEASCGAEGGRVASDAVADAAGAGQVEVHDAVVVGMTFAAWTGNVVQTQWP